MSVSVISRVRGAIRVFKEDSEGAIAVFSVVTFLTMFVGVGMAVDFMRHEAQRAELQDALDRGVLAAAMSPNPSAAKAIVAQYMRSANFIPAKAQVEIDPDFKNSQKTVAAAVEYPIDTFFLKVIGMKRLNVVAKSAASTAVSNIEISLALDISGSMAREDTNVDQQTYIGMGGETPDNMNFGNVKRLDYMKVASKAFVEHILDGTNASNTTINLVPFAGQVNPGAFVMNHMTTSRAHSYSSCIDFSSADFWDADLPGTSAAEQTPHFQWYRFEADYGHNAQWGWCPSDAQAIEYMSNDVTKLHNRIDGFIAHDGTGTQNAMKWSLGLLDERTQPLIASLANQGMVASEFADRPRSKSNTNVMKVIVLMSDGNTTQQARPKTKAYNSTAEIDYWADNSLGRAEGYSPGRRDSYMMSDRTASRNQFKALCSQAKADDVIVFTIGFDIQNGSYAQKDLAACASTTNNFYDVNGVELSEAFAAIATTISKLRLVY